MAKYCLLLFIMAIFIIVPMPILAGKAVELLKKTVEIFELKDPDYYENKFNIGELKKVVRIFEPKDEVALENLKKVVRGAFEKLPDNYNKHHMADFDAYHKEWKNWNKLIKRNDESTKEFLKALDTRVRTNWRIRIPKWTKAGNLWDMILYAHKRWVHGRFADNNTDDELAKELATLCDKLHPHVNSFFEAVGLD